MAGQQGVTHTIPTILLEYWLSYCLREGMSLLEISKLIKDELEKHIRARRNKLLDYLDGKGAGVKLIYTPTNGHQQPREATYMGRGKEEGLASIQIRPQNRGRMLSTVEVDPFTLKIVEDPSFPDNVCAGGPLSLTSPIKPLRRD